MVGTSAPPRSEPAHTRSAIPGTAPVQAANLLISFDTAAALAAEAVRQEDWANAFLRLAGLNQVAEDHLQRDLAGTRKVIALVRRRSPMLASTVEWGRRGGLRLRAMGIGDRRLAAWQAEAERVVSLAADAVVEGDAFADGARFAEAVKSLVRRVSRLPRALRGEILRLPACFRSADQKPADCVALAEAFAVTWSERSRPLIVLGVRTSGSYLAPLVGAALRRLGFTHVEELSCRPDRGFGARQARRMRAAAGSGLVLVIDDSPVSGRTYRSVAQQVAAVGVPEAGMVLLVPVMYGKGEQQLPEGLRSFQAVVLPWTEWAIHRELEVSAVQESLARLLIGRRVEIVRPDGGRTWVTVGAVVSMRQLPLLPVPDMKGGSRLRRHVRGRYQVRLTESESSRLHDAEIYVKGVGFGHFGVHSLALSDPLTEFHPPVYGIEGGCLFRGYLPETEALSAESIAAPDLASRVAAYAVARRDHLRLASDPTERLGEWLPAWRLAADWLQPPFQTSRLLARPFLYAASRRLLRPAVPAVIDGSMALNRWYGAGASAVKVDYDERGLETYSSDPALDVAIAAADSCMVLREQPGFSEAVRRGYTLAGGEIIDDERWLLLRTVHLTAYLAKLGWAWIVSDLDDEERRKMVVEVELVRRALSRVHQEYLSAVYFADLTAPAGGPICAIDIDGVLETGTWGWPTGYPVMTPVAALGLRALAKHGRRAVLVSGRTLPEIRERCEAFRLAGGVAEYGAVTYVHEPGGAEVLTDSRADHTVEAVRGWLRTQPVHVDAGYEHVARAYSVDGEGVRRRLPDDIVAGAVGHANGAVTPVIGTSQVDFLPLGVDKASGLRRLLERMHAGDQLEMAIGDTEADLPMLRLARRAYAPANSAEALRSSGIRTVNGSAQRGFAQAVAEEIGHRPGGCGVCRPQPLSARSRLLIAALEAADCGRAGRLAQVLKVAVGLWR
ncbi:MAG: HAD hydrolase family protein [Candidatus Dormiibacterota bacterium]